MEPKKSETKMNKHVANAQKHIVGALAELTPIFEHSLSKKLDKQLSAISDDLCQAHNELSKTRKARD